MVVLVLLCSTSSKLIDLVDTSLGVPIIGVKVIYGSGRRTHNRVKN